MTEPGECKTCPEGKATCYGGSTVGPNPGYWRMNNYTSLFMKCLYPPACLGMVPPTYNPVGECAEGYQGVLCADCVTGYTRDIDYVCKVCPSKSKTLSKLILIILAVALMVVLIIKA